MVFTSSGAYDQRAGKRKKGNEKFGCFGGWIRTTEHATLEGERRRSAVTVHKTENKSKDHERTKDLDTGIH